MDEKSPDAFKSIGEVASALEIPQHVLRFWETRFPQVRPLKRGGGRRYYRPEDVALLHGIRFLLYSKGFTIKGVQRLLREQGVRFVAATASGDLRAEPGGDAMPVSAAPRLDDRSDPDGPVPDDLALFATAGASEPGTPDDGSEPVGERRSGLGTRLWRRPEKTASATGLGKEQSQQLQEVILELLECKRLLDQVR